ncbi:MAG: hypothetical protein HY717_14465 [Planctomycetes bacterium]|nr:hypothetical protein [Planctomycetota bacterium]
MTETRAGERRRSSPSLRQGQDDVMEKILKARRERDPPWKRQRKAPGPPPSQTVSGAELINPPLEVDHYWVDRPADDDWPP